MKSRALVPRPNTTVIGLGIDNRSIAMFYYYDLGVRQEIVSWLAGSMPQVAQSFLTVSLDKAYEHHIGKFSLCHWTRLMNIT